MKTIVKGIERNQGSFKDENNRDVQYDNIVLHCLNVNDSPKAKIKMLAGKEIGAQQIKLKNDFNKFVYVGEFTPVTAFNDLVDCEIEVFYDVNGRVECVEVKGIGVAL